MTMSLLQQEIIIRLSLSLLLGGLIGLERQYHHKPAGFRTMIMISIGSCLFSLLSTLLDQSAGGHRIAANVVTGIGFLGAGVIFRSANRVNGITTAASIWAVAAVGMSIGNGYYFMSFIATSMILSVLAMLPYVEKLMEKKHLYREYTIGFQCPDEKQDDCIELLGKHHLKFTIIRKKVSPPDIRLNLEVWGTPEDHARFLQDVSTDPFFRSIEYV
jgi:putative Mg2+ transporter-C (MgtC) family protein